MQRLAYPDMTLYTLTAAEQGCALAGQEVGNDGRELVIAHHNNTIVHTRGQQCSTVQHDLQGQSI